MSSPGEKGGVGGASGIDDLLRRLRNNPLIDLREVTRVAPEAPGNISRAIPVGTTSTEIRHPLGAVPRSIAFVNVPAGVSVGLDPARPANKTSLWAVASAPVSVGIWVV